MNIRQDAQRLFSLDKMSRFDIINIAEQTAKVSGCSGVIVFVLEHDYRVTGAKLFLQNNKPVAVEHFDFSIEDCEHLNTGVIETQNLVINGRNLLEHHCALSKLLFRADSTPVGCVVLLAEPNQLQNPTLQLALELAAERLLLAMERGQSHGCPVISANNHLNQKLELLNEIGSISKTGGWEFELETKKIVWTDEMYSIYGLPIGAPVNLESSLSYYSPETKKAIQSAVELVITEGQEYCIEGPLNRADGSVIRIKATGKPRYSGAEITHVYGALEDITEQYRLLETEYNYAAYLTAILDNLNDVVVTIDTNGTIITANKTMSTIFGHQPEDVMGKDVSMLMPDPYAKYHSEFLKHYLETGRAKIIGVGRELPGLHKSGRVFPIELSLSEVIQDGQRQFIGIVKDITERKKALEDIYHTAYFDELTSLPNMRTFEIDLNKVLSQASSHYNALDIYCCLIDMDNFTQYNLSFGKHVGDQILTAIANRIKTVVAGELKLYRGIGDNFLILSTAPIDGDHRESEDTLNTLEWEMHKLITTPIGVDGQTHSVSAAISSCRLEASKASYEKINGVLSFGKKRAKKQGPGSVLTIDKAAFEDYNRYNTIVHSFQRALQNNEFYLLLQPQFNAANQVSGSEALIRWEHPELGMISPVEFIPIAEESDAIIDIGNWVLNEACRLLHECLQADKSTRIAVNISGRHIVRADFTQTLTQLIDGYVRINCC